MSEPTRRTETQAPADPTANTANSAEPMIADLRDNVTTDEADKVRGGLNPQPLPPRLAR